MDTDVQVGTAGDLQMTVPISIPKGVLGIQPAIAISYSSAGSNGLLGQGGSLSGFSIVSRCANTLAADGFSRYPTNSDVDKFCLDGQPLVAVRGEYGASGTEYRTEIYSGQRIISHGQISNASGLQTSPLSFTVINPNGSKMLFGDRNNSRQTLDDSQFVHAWWVGSSVDVHGNRITYRYKKFSTTGPDGQNWYQHLPLSIQYGVNDNVAGSDAQLKVRFEYEDRPDERFFFRNTMAISATKRLTNVISMVGEKLFRDYRITYQQSPVSRVSQMVSITECTINDTCLRPTTLQWANTDKSWVRSATSLPRNLMRQNGQQRGELIDVNGDGFKDVVLAERDFNSRVQLETWLGGSDGYLVSSQWTLPTPLFHNDVNDQSLATARLVDVNADGLVDLVEAYARADHGEVRRTWLNTGQGFRLDERYAPPEVFLRIVDNTSIDLATLIDLDGDMRPDMTVATENFGVVTRGTWINSGAQFVKSSEFVPPFFHHRYSQNRIGEQTGLYADLTGDGYVDYIKAVRVAGGGSRRDVYVNTGAGFILKPSMRPPVVLKSYKGYKHGMRQAELLDINGDGYPDLVESWKESGNTHQSTWLNRGGRHWQQVDSYATPYPMTSGSGKNSRTLGTFADVNGDGLVDLIYSIRRVDSSITNLVYRNNGKRWHQDDGLRLPEPLFGAIEDHRSVPLAILTDDNGDGHPDLIGIKSKRRLIFGGDTPVPPAAVERVTNALGMKHKVVYRTLNSLGDDVGAIDTEWPNAYVAPLGQAVAMIKVSDGIGGWNRTAHRYGPLTTDVTGRGIRGFAWRDAYSEGDGYTIRLRSEFNLDWPMIGTVKRTTKSILENDVEKTLVDTTTEYAVVDIERGLSKLPVKKASWTEAWDLDGTRLPSLTATSTFNEWGQPDNTVETTKYENENYTTQNSVVYENDETNWILGQVHSSTVIRTAADGTSSTTTTEKRYNDIGQVVRTWANADDPLHDVINYAYDSFGNLRLTKVTSKGGTGSSVVTRTNSDATGRFPVEAISPQGHRVLTRWHNRLGLKTREEAPNREIKTWRYDAFGRQIREAVLRDEGQDRGRKDITVMTWCDDATNADYPCPEHAEFFATAVDNVGETPESVYYDKHGRIVRKQSAGHDGRVVFADTHFDRFGNKTFESRPYFALPRGAVDRVLNANVGVRNEYDSLGRIVATFAPQHTEVNPAAIYRRYSGLVTYSTDSLNRESVETRNAIGKVVEIRDVEGNLVSHRYNAAGQLVQTADSANNITTIEYNEWGRKVVSDEPSLGRWTYTYGAFGRLESRTDAQNQTTTMEYDELGRLVRRVEPNGHTQWKFDGHMGIGKLDSVSHYENGVRTYSRKNIYDDYSRLGKVETTVDDQTYVVETRYYGDTDRPLTRIFPTGINVSTRFNTFGNPTSLHTGNLGLLEEYSKHYKAALYFETRARDYEADNAARLKTLEATIRPREADAAPHLAAVDALEPLILSLDKKTAPVRAWFESVDKAHGHGLGLGMPLIEWLAKNIFEPTQTANQELNKIEDQHKPDYLDPSMGSARAYDDLSPADKEKADAWKAYWAMREPWRNQVNAVLSRHSHAISEIDKYVGFESEIMPRLNEYQKIVEPHQANIERYESAVSKYESIMKPIEGLVEEYNSIAEKLEKYIDKATEEVDAASQVLARFHKTAKAHYTIERVAADGQILEAYVGKAPKDGEVDQRLQVKWRYDNAGRLIKSRVALLAGGAASDPILLYRYAYNPDGTLRARYSDVAQVNEHFDYDQLGRLVESVLSGEGTNAYRDAQPYATDDLLTTRFAYDSVGNIVFKSDVGNYDYGQGAGPYAVTSVSGPNGTSSFSYDANGNMTRGNGRSIEWTSFNKPKEIRTNGSLTTMAYGPERQLVKTVEGRDANTTTVHLGDFSVHRKSDSNGSGESVRYRHALRIAGHEVATLESDANGDERRVTYLHRDHLNSLIATTDSAGKLKERLFYDAFGKPRSGLGIDDSYATRALSEISNRGYTNHIMLSGIGLIHMGGRVYDPVLARFLSADPHVQFPHYSQGFNRYSYLLNDPLSATDPTGFFLKSLFKAIGKLFDKLSRVIMKVMSGVMRVISKYGRWIAVIAMMAMVKPLAAGIANAGIAAKTALTVARVVMGGMIGFATTGSFRGLVAGAFSGWAFATIGASSLNSVAAKLAHGLAGGIAAKIQGTSFSRGFVSSFVNKVVAPVIERIIPASMPGIISAGIAGGSINAILGGSFGRGAASAMMAYAFNQIGKRGLNKWTQANVTHARLANGVYNLDFEGADGYKKVGDTTVDEKTGFQYALFVNDETKHAIVSYAGTDPTSPRDWIANFRQGRGATSSQYEQAIVVANEQYYEHNGNITFVGHSLGGGLAMASAIATSTSATVFNASWVHGNTVSSFDIGNASITHIYSSQDALQGIMRGMSTFFNLLRLGTEVNIGYAGLHPMGSVCDKMGC